MENKILRCLKTGLRPVRPIYMSNYIIFKNLFRLIYLLLGVFRISFWLIQEYGLTLYY